MVAFATEPEYIERVPSPHVRQGSDASTSTASSGMSSTAVVVERDLNSAVPRRMPFAPTPYPTKPAFSPGAFAPASSEGTDSGPFGWVKKALRQNGRPAAPRREAGEFEGEAIAQLDGHAWAKDHLTDPMHDPRDRHVKIVESVPSERKYGHARTGSRSRSLTAADLLPSSI